MISSVSEPTIDELLNDDITSSLRRADRVNVSALTRMLHGVASSIGSLAACESNGVAATPCELEEIARETNTEGRRRSPRGQRFNVDFFN
jgi:hypothetical protein